MSYFPMFIELEGQEVWIVGGGHVALRKILKLMPYDPTITVIAPEIIDEIKCIEGLIVIEEAFDLAILENVTHPLAMVIAATDNRELNQEISEVCHRKEIPVNVVDDLENCSFVFPALVKQGAFSAGICTSGVSPTASVYYKNCLKESLPEQLEEILNWMEQKRKVIKAIIPEQKKRASFYKELFQECIKKGRPLTEAEWTQYERREKVGCVALVGAGCGKADLITVRGLRLLKQCEAVVYDDLIDMELLEEVPESAERIYVGKRRGRHSSSQEEINQILIGLAKRGLSVVRLKGGDPYVFGRGGEEMQALIQEGIPCQEVPGIPSAIGIPAEVGIPVTHRGASRGLHIITAHTCDTVDGLPEDFDELARLSGTLVFLMGFSKLEQIATRLVEAGKDPHTPAAVISGGNSMNPGTVRGTLEDIYKKAVCANMSSPAIVLVGEVAAIAL